jgi:iron(III) transport system ATP-binding protein
MKGLSVSGVVKSFGGQTVLHGVDVDVPEGSFTAILGASGSGKTTLLRIIAGFERPDAGVVQLGPEVVDDAGHRFVPSERRRIGYVPQEGALFPHLNVGRNVAFGLRRDSKERRRERVRELVDLVGLSGLGRRYPHQLSGGQQQRVALARALAAEPEIVLLDEPFSSLDAALRASVRADVHAVLRQAGITAILVTHDQDEALSMADQVAVLRHGVIAQIGTPAGLYGQPNDSELARFLGEANLVEGMMRGDEVATALGTFQVGAWIGPAAARAADGPAPVTVMVRPEQLRIGQVDAAGVAGEVRSYHYFGHDAVVQVRPDMVALPELVVRITGGSPVALGSRVGLLVLGPVVAWPVGGGPFVGGAGAPEISRITPP